MVSLRLFPSEDARKYMAKLFRNISEGDYEEIAYNANQLKEELLKYYQTRTVDCEKIHNLFEEFDYVLRTYSPGRTKTRKLYSMLGEISRTSYLVHTPIERLRLLREDLRFFFLQDPKENMPYILGCFDEIQELEPEMKKIGGTIYNYYSVILQNIGACEAALGKLRTATPKESVLNELSQSFSKLFTSIMKIIAPPVIIQASDEELYTLAKKGISIQDIAEGLGEDENELATRLAQIEAKYATKEEEEQL